MVKTASTKNRYQYRTGLNISHRTLHLHGRSNLNELESSWTAYVEKREMSRSRRRAGHTSEVFNGKKERS
jgi:hypothetical protein